MRSSVFMGMFLVLTYMFSNSMSSKEPDYIIAIGDIHGDIVAFKKTLQINGIINDRDEWIFGSNTVIQMGDLIDRGENDREVLEYAMNLENIAKNAGGEYIQLLGNHEIMNLENYYMYAIDDIQDGKIIGFGTREERIKALKPDSPIGKWLREKDLIYKWKNDTVFVHGGISDINIVNIGIDSINKEYKHILNSSNYESEKKKTIESIVWDRYLSLGNNYNTCDVLDNILNNLNVKRMVVGHTITSTVGFKPGEIGDRCGGKIILTDVGMSNYYKSIPFTGNVAILYEL